MAGNLSRHLKYPLPGSLHRGGSVRNLPRRLSPGVNTDGDVKALQTPSGHGPGKTGNSTAIVDIVHKINLLW